MSDNLNQPKEYDAVLSDKNSVAVGSLVLGGLEGVKTRLNSQVIEVQIAALKEAFNYGDVGLDLVLQAWQNESGRLKWEAYTLLLQREEKAVKYALQRYNHWLNMSCTQTWQQNSAVKSVAITQNGETLVSGNQAGDINVWDMQTKQQKPFSMNHLNVNSLAITPNGNILVSRGGDYDREYIIKVWSLNTGELQHTLKEYAHVVSSLIISPDGKTLACGTINNTINVWDLENRVILRALNGHRYLTQALAISTDGKTLVSGSNDKNVKVWEFETGKLTHTFKKHSDGIESVAISPDGQTIVSGSKDKTVNVWNLRTKKLKFTLEGHTGWVYCVAISPDGNYIFSGSRDKTIRVWNLHSGECQHILKGHTDWVYCLALSADGNNLVSGSRDKTIKVWGVKK